MILRGWFWSGLWVTFSGMDKIGHMWGGGLVDTVQNYSWDPNSLVNQVHMQWIATNADAMLGALLAELKKKGRDKETLVILTADHGQTYGKGGGFKGDDKYDSGNLTNWYAGAWHAGVSAASSSPGSAALKPLMDTGNVEFSYQSTAIETWLRDSSPARMQEAAQVMKALPGVIATYTRAGDHYTNTWSSTTMTALENGWWQTHGQELVDSMCWAGSADVVGLLADYTSYGVYGDHGGAQRDVQNIPMVFYTPGIEHGTNESAIRLVDLMPTVLRTIGVSPDEPSSMDGKAYALEPTITDTEGPSAEALAPVKTRYGRACTISYRVNDPQPSCGKATVWLEIKSADMRVRYRTTIEGVATNRKLTYTFRCPLKPYPYEGRNQGVYRYYLTCRDAAGNDGTGDSAGFRVY